MLLRPLVSSSRRIFIYDLLDAEFITSMVPRNYLILILPVYYIAVAGIVFITMKIFFGLNARQYGRFAAILAENTGTAAESRPL